MTEKTRDGSISVRVNKSTKEQAADILWGYGLTIGDAVNILLCQIVRLKGLPFDLRPSEDVQTAMEQVRHYEQTGKMRA